MATPLSPALLIMQIIVLHLTVIWVLSAGKSPAVFIVAARWFSLHAVQGIPLFWHWHFISSGHQMGLCVTFQLEINLMHFNVNQPVS